MTIYFTYKAPKTKPLTDEQIAAGVTEPILPHHPGIPLRDLTAEDVAELPPHLYDTLAASDLYEATSEGKRHYNAAVRARTPEPPAAPSKPATKAETKE